MRKRSFGVMVLCLVILSFIITGCEENIPDETPPVVLKPQRAIPVSPTSDPSKVVVLDSYTDDAYNYYLINGGYVLNTYIGTMQEVHYNGVTQMTSSSIPITEENITKFLKQTVTNSYSDTSKYFTNSDLNVGYDWIGMNFKIEQESKRDSTSVKYTEDSFKTVKKIMQENSITFTVGLQGEPAGWYRYSLYMICDIYFLVITSTDNEELLSFECIAYARGDTIQPYFEYSDDGIFDYTPENSKLLSLPEEFWKTIPQPIHDVDNNFSGRISAGQMNTLVIDNEGNLYVFGNNILLPQRIKPGTKFKTVCAGYDHSLALDIEGNLWAWGANDRGQLGDGTYIKRTEPVRVREGTKFIKISAGYDHSMAIDAEGSLWLWGDNNDGELGNGRMSFRQPFPEKMWWDTGFIAIAAGYDFSLAIDAEGKLWPWGDGSSGQHGNSTEDSTVRPENQVKSATPYEPEVLFKSVSVQYKNVSAIDTEDNVWTWGNRNPTPMRISGTKFKKASAGNGFHLAIDKNSNLWVWGNNYFGNLGTGKIVRTSNEKDQIHVNESYPVLTVRSDVKFVEVSAGVNHSIAMDIQGRIWGWGDNSYRQLGKGDTETIIIPVLIFN